ncbi:MAG: transcriptional regulator [Saprospiraceae bacterium]|nr:transcriptional regulator [Saprospiraceae bacterium]
MFKDLDPLLHSQLRLAIISYLVANRATDFNELKMVTKATSGNLSVQLKKLQAAEYLKIEKGFKNNYQHTAIEITPQGIDAFETYVTVLKEYLDPS